MPRVFDFFSGCGGASRGFQNAGMAIVFALDWDRDAANTFEANFPTAKVQCRDIHESHAERIAQLVDRQRPHPVLFCGCAPCQPFSKQNSARRDPRHDDRASLLREFLRFIVECTPDIVFVENVPGIQTFDQDAEPMRGFLRGLDKVGYRYCYDTVSLKHFGVPQARRRFLLLASRHGPIEFPDHTHGPSTPNPAYKTVRHAIGDLPDVPAGATHPDIANHRAARLSDLNLERIRETPEGGGYADWPKRLWLECHRKTKGYSDAYGRMSWDKPASGLTTRCISYSNGRFGHPKQDRAITVREAACLQTFPMDFQFFGSLNAMAKQIGNAVPVRVAEVVGRHFLRHLRDVGAT